MVEVCILEVLFYFLILCNNRDRMAVINYNLFAMQILERLQFMLFILVFVVLSERF